MANKLYKMQKKPIRKQQSAKRSYKKRDVKYPELEDYLCKLIKDLRNDGFPVSRAAFSFYKLSLVNTY